MINNITVFPYEKLKKQNKYDKNIDIRNRELHLSDSEFQKIFNMTKNEFNNLKDWKKKELKKKYLLF